MNSQIHIDLTGNALDALKALEAKVDSMGKSVTAIEKSATTKFESIGKSIKSISFVSATQGLQNLTQGFNDLNAPGLKFSTALADVEAITGVTGKALENLGEKARASAKEFGGTASDSLDTYKTILSRLGGDIAKSQPALEGMERSVRVLSKTMGNDAVGATDALTTAVLQYGVDLSDPIQAQKEMTKMMNVMAAGAKFGAAEVPGISAALKVAGVQAKQSKVSFEETNSALQALAAGGKEGSEAGIALRNVLGKMAGDDILPKEASMKLKQLGVDMRIVSNTSLPFTTRLKELKKAQGDATIMAQVFGVENAAAANILLDSTAAQDKLTKAITGTNVGFEQAAIIMETPAEKVKRMQANIDDLKTSFFLATGGATSFLEPVSQLATTMSAFAPIVSSAWKGVSKLKDIFTKTADPITKVGAAATKTGKSVESSAKASKTAGMSFKGLGGAMGAIGWTAVAAGITMVATRIWDVASGANAAREKMEAFNKGAAKGHKEGEKEVAAFDKKTQALLDKNQNLTTAGDQTEAEGRKKQIAILKQHEWELKQEIHFQSLMRKTRTKELEKQRKQQALVQTADVQNIEGIKEFLGIHNEQSKVNFDRGALAETDAHLKDLLGSSEQVKREIAAAEAEAKGAKRSPSLLTPLTEQKTLTGTGEPVKNINVRIEQLVGKIEVHSTTVNESITKIKQMVTEALVGAVRDTEIAL